MPSLKRPPPPRRCIYCGVNNANSKEHFWSEWTHALLPKLEAPSYQDWTITTHPIEGLKGHRSRKRQGDVYTKKLRVVCEDCNNGWMSQIENTAKGLLAPLIRGERVKLDADGAYAVARWVANKIMVAEHNDRSLYVTTKEDRLAFKEHGVIPAFFRIYVTAHSCASQSGFIRHSRTIAFGSKQIEPPLAGRERNAQQISFLLGSMFVHVNAADVSGYAIEDSLLIPRLHGPGLLWPWQWDTAEWPTIPPFSLEEVREISNSIESLSQVAKWGGDLPA